MSEKNQLFHTFYERILIIIYTFYYVLKIYIIFEKNNLTY